MDKVNKYLEEIGEEIRDGQGPPTEYWEIVPNANISVVTLTFRNRRKQTVRVFRHREHYVIESVVLTAGKVEEMGLTKILPIVWHRNNDTNVVEFVIEKKGRLVGRIEEYADTLDKEELEFYLTLLARECDGFEFVLEGFDHQ